MALSPIPVVAAIGLLGTRRPLTNSLGFVAGWVIHLAVVSVVLLAAVRGQGQFGGAALTRPLAVVLLAMGVALMIGAFATWRGPPAGAGALRRRLGRMDQLSPRTAFLAGFLAVSLNAKNVALTLSTVHGIQSAHAGVGESVAVVVLFIMVGTAGVAAPAALSVALAARAGPLLEAWRFQLADHSGPIVSWVLLGTGTLLIISAFLTLRG